MAAELAPTTRVQSRKADEALYCRRLPLRFPCGTPLRSALLLAGWVCRSDILLHFASSLWGSHLGYGFFRDELYFLVCGIILRGDTSISRRWWRCRRGWPRRSSGSRPPAFRIFSFFGGRGDGRPDRPARVAAWRARECAGISGDGGRACRSVFLGHGQLPLDELVGAMLLDGRAAGGAARGGG